MAERICSRCRKVRQPPIEGPCPHCRGYYRTVRRASHPDGEQGERGGAMSAAALFRRHENDPVLSRRPTGLSGLDHVFCGGLPMSGTILVSARDGVGKTSLLWELSLTLAIDRVQVLYISSEQSQRDLVAEFHRFGRDRIERAGRYLRIAAEKDYLNILDLILSSRAEVLTLDSLHLVDGVIDDHDQPLRSGGAAAVERIARDVKELAGEQDLLAFLVGHMNNDGTMAGGSHLRHVVDATLGLRRIDEDDLGDPRRILRFETKTRFGEMGREALFKMTEGGFRDCGPRMARRQDDDDDDDGTPPRGGRLRVVN